MASIAGTIPPKCTEEEFWQDFNPVRDDVNAAISTCYTYNAINDLTVKDAGVYHKLNRRADFWRLSTYSLQTTMFIVMARIFDQRCHSIYTVLHHITGNPELFSANSLRARKLNQNPGWERSDLDKYIADAWFPAIEDVRQFKKQLGPHTAKFNEIYRPIRDKAIAHRELNANALVSELYSKTLKTDIDRILCFLYTLLRAIEYLLLNGMQPKLDGDNYGFAERARGIAKKTEEMLRELPES